MLTQPAALVLVLVHGQPVEEVAHRDRVRLPEHDLLDRVPDDLHLRLRPTSAIKGG